MNTTCPKCNGSRMITVPTGYGPISAISCADTVSCPQCNGSGSVDDGQVYFVLWFNRRRLQLEMHAAHCGHELMTKPQEYENLSAHWTSDLRESMRDIHDGSKPYSVLIEDCLL